MNILEMKVASSLEKIFPDTVLSDGYLRASALRGEAFSFQIAYRAPSLVKRLRLTADTGGLPVSLFRVGLVPAEMPGYGDEDDFVLRTAPGLFPDPLYPLAEDEELYAYPNQWRSIFCTIEIPQDARPGTYSLQFCISGHDDSTFGHHQDWQGEAGFTLTILPAALPRQTIPHTEWFAADCITTWYGLETFSDAWWVMVEKYIKNAVSHGINMILTPLFTPPLETAVGTERETIQLVSIEKTGEQYHFGFENLEKWIRLCQKSGVEYFEMPHLFTQWGAEFTPKIIITENNAEKKLFGWHVRSDSAEYRDFLEQFLPAAISVMTNYVEKDHIFFHISDEPSEDCMERYTRLSELVKGLIGGCPMIDAMSSLKLFQRSALTAPVTATDEIEPFLEAKAENLWAYYACLQNKNYLSNRFLCFPSNRNRIIGMQLYRHKIKGFLQWGYNHWYSGLSVKRLNPFEVTDADACFPAGDSFLVYPGEDGPVNSLRIAVLREAFQDIRALELLESLVGEARVLEILEEGIAPITFTEYPHEICWMLEVRERINAAIADEYGARQNVPAISEENCCYERII